MRKNNKSVIEMSSQELLQPVIEIKEKQPKEMEQLAFQVSYETNTGNDNDEQRDQIEIEKNETIDHFHQSSGEEEDENNTDSNNETNPKSSEVVDNGLKKTNDVIEINESATNMIDLISENEEEGEEEQNEESDTMKEKERKPANTKKSNSIGKYIKKHVNAPSKTERKQMITDIQNAPIEIQLINNFIKYCNNKHEVECICWFTFHQQKKRYRMETEGNTLRFQCSLCEKYIEIKVIENPFNVFISFQEFNEHHLQEVWKQGDGYTHWKKISEGAKLIERFLPSTKIETITKELFGKPIDNKYGKKIFNRTFKMGTSLESYLEQLEAANEMAVETQLMRNMKGEIESVVITFPACDLLKYCCYIIGIDGTFNKERQTTTIVASTIDMNRNILCLGLSFAMQENKSAVVLLLESLKKRFTKCEGFDMLKIVFISDRGLAILVSVREIFPLN